jgi:DNA-binding response OmpR family regulator
MNVKGPDNRPAPTGEQRSEALLVLRQQGPDGYPQDPGQTWTLDKPVTSIGRWEDNDIVIPDRWVSRHHAHIRREGTRYVVEDLGSKNGLFVNGKRVITPVALENGDHVQVAPRYSLTFIDSEATAPLPSGYNGVLIDSSARCVWVGGQELEPPLSSAQYALLTVLVDAPGRVFSRDELIDLIWPDEDPAGISDEALNSLVRRLRRRLMSLDPGHRYIYAVRGHGFKYEPPSGP